MGAGTAWLRAGSVALAARSLEPWACDLWWKGSGRVDSIWGRGDILDDPLLSCPAVFSMFMWWEGSFSLLKIWTAVGFYTDIIKSVQTKSKRLKQTVYFHSEAKQAVRVKVL